MFRGNHPARVDEKGRLKVPSEFKAELEAQGRECFITSRDGQRAEIHSLKDWEQIEEALAKLPASGPKKRLLDATNYYGQLVRMDEQGRLLIPQLLREAASLVGDVAVMGIERKLVVANDARLRAAITENPATDADIESLGVVGL
ncbi:MAG TPA: division/cell wall cluster transcriptional repressor MraZ [Acidobacteriaceae bacterium]|jgi:MraZ protein|nr:division/cell wall cluster transcriptional repressor MraZ [Acidobacteriaceae bacterium]